MAWTFDPSELRDFHGRWSGHGGGPAEHLAGLIKAANRGEAGHVGDATIKRLGSRVSVTRPGSPPVKLQTAEEAAAHVLATAQPTHKEVGAKMAAMSMAWSGLAGSDLSEAPPMDEIVANFTRHAKGTLSSDSEVHAAVARGLAENAANPVHSAIVAKHLPDNVVVIKDSTPAVSFMHTNGAAHRVAGTTVANEAGIRDAMSGRKDPHTSKAAAASGYGVAALLRHEYGHSLEDTLSKDTLAQIHAALPNPERDLSYYSGYYGHKGEVVPELYALVTHPNYHPADWPSSVQKAGAILLKALGSRSTPGSMPSHGVTFDTSGLKSPGAIAAVKSAEQAIGRVVNVRQPISFQPLPDHDTATARGLSASPTIALHEDSGPAILTEAVVHEFGHMLDQHVVGNPEEPATYRTETEALLKPMRDSPTMQAVRHDQVALLAGDTQTRNYMLQGREMLARAFSQYVAIHSGDPGLLDTLHKLQADKQLGFQTWQPEEFKPIDAALTKWLGERGLLAR